MPQLKTHPKLQTKDKEWNTSYIDVASSWDSTEVYYTTKIGPKTTRKELYSMGNSEKDVSGKIEIKKWSC